MTLSKHLYFLTQSYHMTSEDFSKALWSLAASIIHFHCIEKKQPRHSAKLHSKRKVGLECEGGHKTLQKYLEKKIK